MNLGRSVMSLLMAITCVMGAAALASGTRLIVTGGPNMAGAVVAVVMGLVLIGLAIAYGYVAYVKVPAAASRLQTMRARYPGQPWMERPEWASRRLESSSKGTAALMWVWTSGWWFFIALIGTVNRDKIAKALEESWWNAALIAVFIGAGLAGLLVAITFTAKARRYGVSSLGLDTFPAFMGEEFTGTLTARLTPRPRHPLSVVLACEDVEWVTTGYGDKRKTRRVVRKLGSVSTTADARTFSPSNVGQRGRLSINVPRGLPASSRDDRGNGVRWWLRIATTGDDDPFSCEFEIPVFERPKT